MSEFKPAGSERERQIQRLLILTRRQALRYEARYYDFFKAAWEVLEPNTPLLDNWHIEYLCDELQAVVERVGARQNKLYDLDINISPRSLKSYIVSIMLCPWAWTRWPHLKFINTSYDSSLSTEHNVKSRDLIESDWYKLRWGHVYSLKTDQNVKTHFENNKGGARYATSVEGSITGKGGDVIIADDLINPEKADSEREVEKANKYFDNTLSNRLNDQTIGVKIIVMQRLHDNDVTGHVRKKYKDNYKFIVIPAELDKVLPEPVELVKKYRGGLFFPARFTREVLDGLKKIGLFYYAGQYLQCPAPPGGSILKRENWRFYRTPPKFDKIIQSWDLNFKKTKSGSHACCTVWGKSGIDVYLLYLWKERVDFVDVLPHFYRIRAMFPTTAQTLVEDKANGPAVISTLSKKISGLKPFPPHGDKVARMQAMSYVQADGNAYLPDPALHPWVNTYIETCALFPNSTENDSIDTTSQAWYFLYDEVDEVARLRDFIKKSGL